MKSPKTFTLLKSILLIAFSLALSHLDALAYNFSVDGIYYIITNPTAHTVAVTYEDEPDIDEYYSDYTGNVTIPSTVTYNDVEYSVTSIDMFAFYCCYNLTSVVIPESIIS